MRKTRIKGFLFIVIVLALLVMAFAATTAWAVGSDVTVTYGPTPIANGACVGANDITITNEFLAISIAVDSTPPWGVPKGSILDGTTVTNGVIGRNKLVLVDFLPNDWSAWPNTYQDISVTENTTDKAVVTVRRDYFKMQLVTTYTVEKGNRFVGLSTTATNPAGSGESYADILTAYTFCTTGGYMFGPYGLAGISTIDPYGKYVLGYDSDYSIGLHFPAADSYWGGSGWKDLFLSNTFAPGDVKTFEGAVEFEDSASISRFVKAAADKMGVTCGTVSGTIQPSGGPVLEAPILVVEKVANGTLQPFTWTVGENGSYSLDLPPGDYSLYAIAKDYSATAKVPVTVVAGETLSKSFSDLSSASTVTVKVAETGSGRLIDARIAVTGGIPPLVGFLGKSTFFTDLTDVGTATFKLAPGTFTFNITAGDKFVSKAASIPVTVVAGQDPSIPVQMKTVFMPANHRWYAADPHHHSDILDGVSAPAAVVQSQLAARLDFTFVSDHDSFANNALIAQLSEARGVPFIGSDEISPIWAHFNVLPMSVDHPVTIDPAGTAKQIIDAAHAAGMVIAINHPYIAYGYFTAADAGTIPGGYDADFDLIELQSTAAGSGTSPDELTLQRTFGLWTSSLTGENKKYYLKSGSDVHDVWKDVSGSIRQYAKIEMPKRLSQENYTQALLDGHSYVTEGPLVEPLGGLMFGDRKIVNRGHPSVTVSLHLAAVYSLKKIDVVSEGSVVETRSFSGTTTTEDVTFSYRPAKNTYYSFIVEDENGNRAVTNPVWVKVAP